MIPSIGESFNDDINKSFIYYLLFLIYFLMQSLLNELKIKL